MICFLLVYRLVLEHEGWNLGGLPITLLGVFLCNARSGCFTGSLSTIVYAGLNV
jgi:hypothetical protein